MIEDQFSVLKDQNNTLQKSLDILANDREHDAKKLEELSTELQEVRIRLGAMEGQIDEMRKGQTNIVDKVQKGISEATEPIREQAQNLAESINDATVVKIKEKKKSWKLPRFKFWKK